MCSSDLFGAHGPARRPAVLLQVGLQGPPAVAAGSGRPQDGLEAGELQHPRGQAPRGLLVVAVLPDDRAPQPPQRPRASGRVIRSLA